MSAAHISDTAANNLNQPDPRLTLAQGTGWQSGPLAGICFLLASGLLAWLLVHAVHPVFATTEGADEFGFLPPAVQSRLDRNNAMFVLGLLGGLTGVGLAVSEVRHRPSWRTTLTAVVWCGAVGAVFGGLAGYVGHRAFEFYKADRDLDDLGKAIRVQCVTLAWEGAGAGLGAGVFLGRSFRLAIRCCLGGLLAGILAGIVYPTIVAALMPGAMTTVLIPLEVRERVLWFSLFSTALGAIIPSVARTDPRTLG